MKKRTTKKASRIYSKWSVYLIGELGKRMPSIIPSKPMLKFMVLQYLFFKICNSSKHAYFLHKKYPCDTHSDIASITRGIFEAVINFIYLLEDSDNLKLASFCCRSVQEELKINKAMIKWKKHEDKAISGKALMQFDTELPNSEKLEEAFLRFINVNKRDVPKWPNIISRCSAVGEVWFFYYDLWYRGLSSWEHGDIGKMFVSPGFKLLDEDQSDRNLFESLGAVSWIFEIIVELCLEISKKYPDNELENVSKGSRIYVHKHIEPLIEKHVQRFQGSQHNKKKGKF